MALYLVPLLPPTDDRICGHVYDINIPVYGRRRRRRGRSISEAGRRVLVSLGGCPGRRTHREGVRRRDRREIINANYGVPENWQDQAKNYGIMSAQVASRPVSGMVGKLPEIQHPLSRLANPTDMELRGVSRAGGDMRSMSQVGRPLAREEDSSFVPRSRLGSRLGSRGSMTRRSMPDPYISVDAIPEGVEVTAGDPSKTRLPIFGE